MAKFRPISESAFKRAQARADKNPTPYVVGVGFDDRTGTMFIELSNQVTVGFEQCHVDALKKVSKEDLAGLRVEGGGSIISFPKLDIYLSVGMLLEQFFGPMEWGRRERRAAASRENGKRGGRPKQTVAEGRILENAA